MSDLTVTATGITSPTLNSATDPKLDEIIERRLIRTIYQPIVELASGRVVAAEALSRGPAGSSLESPLAMLAAAETAGLLESWDEACLGAAIANGVPVAAAGDVALFVNAEPRASSPATLRSLADASERDVDVVVELTERQIGRDVAQLLSAADRIRELGARVAIDDVGAEPASLALVELLRPDVVKLDMQLIHEYGSTRIAEIANAVRAYAEQSGAQVVAEGVESERDEQIAIVLGAHLAQGWRYGRPEATLPQHIPHHRLTWDGVTPLRVPQAGSPYDVVRAGHACAIGAKDLLLPLSNTLEQGGLKLPLPPLVLSAFQHARHFTPGTYRRYTALAQQLPIVCALGAGLDAVPAPGVRGSRLSPDDVLIGEWSVVVLGAHFAGALVGKDLGDTGPDAQRRFSFAVTHDRPVVVGAARALAGRLTAQG